MLKFPYEERIMIGDRLRELREKNHYTQRYLGKYLNISHVAYGAYERGNAFPDIATIRKICELYKISIDYLLNENADDMLMIPKKDYDNLKKAFSEVNKLLNNIDKKIFDSNTFVNNNNVQIGNHNSITTNGNVAGDVFIGQNIKK